MTIVFVRSPDDQSVMVVMIILNNQNEVNPLAWKQFAMHNNITCKIYQHLISSACPGEPPVPAPRHQEGQLEP